MFHLRKTMPRLFVVIRQDVSVSNPVSVLLSINGSHIKATESMHKFVDEDHEEYDEHIIVDANRTETFDRSPAWVGYYKSLRMVYSIQEFLYIGELTSITRDCSSSDEQSE